MANKNPVIDSNGSKEWYKDGKLHRADGPAVEDAIGYKEWWLNGKLHRIDGPAIEDANGYKAWYVNDVELSSELFLKLTKGDAKDLPLHLGLGFDEFISKRLNACE